MHGETIKIKKNKIK